MTDITSTAQALKDHFLANVPISLDHGLAAILRVAAAQGRRGPEHWEGSHPDDFDKGWDAAMDWVAKIAAEMDPATLAQLKPAKLTDEEILELSEAHEIAHSLGNGRWEHPFQEGYDMRKDLLSYSRALIARAALAQPEPGVPPMPVPGDAEGLAEVFWGRYDQPKPVPGAEVGHG